MFGHFRTKGVREVSVLVGFRLKTDNRGTFLGLYSMEIQTQVISTPWDTWEWYIYLHGKTYRNQRPMKVYHTLSL